MSYSTKVDRAFKRFNTKAHEWLSVLNSLSVDEFEKRTSKDKWSLAELYDHIRKVAYTYQIVNLEKSLDNNRKIGKGANLFAFSIFQLNFVPKIKIKMESFPPHLVKKFTPEQKNQDTVRMEFEKFIQDVNALRPLVQNAKKNDKTYHPMFGTISTLNWFKLIEIHLRHHDRQRDKIANVFL